ncbi:hypothetical protein C6T66_01975 [Burkholderia multivorans]|nr:hypothetical protein BURMUCGD1_2487 [Burkholderia multivorans CGD1]PRG94463.1 hypothetical protein C6T66_01975 [Burkholderia multivorans]
MSQIVIFKWRRRSKGGRQRPLRVSRAAMCMCSMACRCAAGGASCAPRYRRRSACALIRAGGSGFFRNDVGASVVIGGNTQRGKCAGETGHDMSDIATQHLLSRRACD